MLKSERAVNERSTGLRGAKTPSKTPPKGPKPVDKSTIRPPKSTVGMDKTDTLVHRAHTIDNKARTSAHLPTTPTQMDALDSFDVERVGRVCMILDECDIWRTAGLNLAL